ncbi:MAG: glutamine amidotransferase [Armatimonadota bacterium]
MIARTSLFVIFVVACLCGLSAASANMGQLSYKIVSAGDKSLVVLRNSFVQLTFDPARGGRCTSFRLLDTGKEIIATDQSAGMFIDHWAKYVYPSGLMHLPYKYKIVGDGKSRLGIELSLTVPEMGGGRGAADKRASMSIPTGDDLAGLVITKTIYLNAANNLVEVSEACANPTKKSRSVAQHVQQAIETNRAYEWYMPSTQGLALRVHPKLGEGLDTGPDWVKEPTAGWIAVRERETNDGLLFVFDYNYLRSIYTCGTTAEWLMDAVPLGLGKEFETDYVVKPVSGFEGFVYGSKRIVADIRADEVDGEVRVCHDIAAVSDELNNVVAEVIVYGWKSKEALDRRVLVIDRVGFKKTSQEFTFSPESLSDGVVFKVSVKGRGFEEHYEYYYAGDKAEYIRKYNPSGTTESMAPLAGTNVGAYFQKPPRRDLNIKNTFNVDFSKLMVGSRKGCQVFVGFGLYTDILHIDDALGTWLRKGEDPAVFTWASCLPGGAENLPGSYEETFGYDTIVLSDVNKKSLGDINLEMLCDYVEHGGSLLVTGGPYAFGNGEFDETRFLKVLPVEISGPFDLKWAGKGNSWDLLAADAESPLLSGVSFAQKPKVFWQHFVTPKKGSIIVLKAGGKPALVLGRYGKGRVAVLTLSPTGEGQGETQWWDWNGWDTLVRNVFTWLNQ